VSAHRPPSSGLHGAGLLIVDKDGGMTSHDVVARCRKILQTRKVGHAGTLDPMATGVLVLGVERATKLLGLLSLTTKAYTATIRLGQATTTDDAEGEVLTTADASGVTDDEVAAVIATLTGAIEQVPTRVSAIKVDGQRAHKLVRDGEDFELAARPVTVDRFDVTASRRVESFVGRAREGGCADGNKRPRAGP
jgi:tRNA pseudouridine55 synthase